MKELGSGVVQTTAAYWLRAMHQPLIVDASQLRGAAAHDTIVWDVRSTRHHQADNPEGAVSIGQIDWLLASPGGTTLVGGDVISRVLRRIGIGPGRAVIVYADRAASAGFLALRALRAIGVERARIFLGDHGPESAGASALQAFWRTQAMRHPARALVTGRAPAFEFERLPADERTRRDERARMEGPCAEGDRADVERPSRHRLGYRPTPDPASRLR